MRFQCCVSNPQWKERFNFKVTFFCQTVWLFLSLCKCDIVNANLFKVLPLALFSNALELTFHWKVFTHALLLVFFEGQVWIFNFGKNPRRSHSTWSLVGQVVTLDGGDESNVHCTYIRIQIQRRQNTWMLGTWSLVSIMLSQFVAQPRDLMFTKFQP